MTLIAAYVITLNEERHIERCITSLQTVCDYVLLLDSGSTDRTVEIGSRLGAVVAHRDFDSYAGQRNYALDQISRSEIRPTHVLSLDADEYFSVEGLFKLQERIEQGHLPDVGLFHYRLIFEGRRLQHGTRRSVVLARLHRCYFRFEERDVNEHLSYPDSTRTEVLDAVIEHDDSLSWHDLIAKHNTYSDKEAKIRFDSVEYPFSLPFKSAMRRRELRNRWLRRVVFERLPAKPLFLFAYQYVLKLGFLDGREGMDRIVLDCINEFLIDRKFRELHRLRRFP